MKPNLISQYSGDAFRDIWKKGDKWYWRYSFESVWFGPNDKKEPNFDTGKIYCLAEEDPVQATKVDPVVKPNHYILSIKDLDDKDTKIDCLLITKELGLKNHHYIASAFAYIWRCLHKGNTLQDLKKAREYLDREIKDLEDEASKR